MSRPRPRFTLPKRAELVHSRKSMFDKASQADIDASWPDTKDDYLLI